MKYEHTGSAPRFCHQCGYRLHADGRFCSNCGAATAEIQVTTTPRPQDARSSPETATSQRVRFTRSPWSPLVMGLCLLPVAAAALVVTSLIRLGSSSTGYTSPITSLALLFWLVLLLASLLMVSRALWFLPTRHTLTISGGRMIVTNRRGKLLAEGNIADITRPDWRYEHRKGTGGNNVVTSVIDAGWGLTRYEGLSLALRPTGECLKLGQFGGLEDIIRIINALNPSNVPLAAIWTSVTNQVTATPIFGKTVYSLVIGMDQPTLQTGVAEHASATIRVDDEGRVLVTRLADGRVAVDGGRNTPLGEEAVAKGLIAVKGELLTVKRFCTSSIGLIGGHAARAHKGNGKAKASLALGIVGVVAWALPFVGLAVSAVGLLLGREGIRSGRTKLAKTAMALNAVCLVLSVWNGAVGALLRVLRSR